MAKKPVAKPATKKPASKQNAASRPEPTLRVETITHDDASRKNIPTTEYQSVLKESTQKPVKIKYPRNTDLDPQLV